MNKFGKILILIGLLAIFGIFEIYKNSGTKVIKIYSANKIAIDLNRNKVIDDGEIVCIPDVDVFTSDIKVDQSSLAKANNLSKTDSIKIGYLTDKFAEKLLENKNVKVNFYDNHTPTCKLAEITVNNKKYKEEVFNEGFALINNKPYNTSKFNDLLEQARKLTLVVANPSSEKFHSLNCKYGINSADYEILPIEEAEKLYQKCKYCLKNYKENVQTTAIKPNYTEQKFVTATHINEILQKENITFIVSDFTQILKSDRKCSHHFCTEMVNVINSTTKTLDIAAYGWADIPKVSSAIKNAEKRGVKIRVIYDKRNGKEYYPETQAFISSQKQTRSDENINNKTLTSMLMHNKFLISDNSKVYTGSMNFSTTGLSGFNANNVVVISSPTIASLYTKEFEQMYSGKFHTEKLKNPDYRTEKINNTQISAYFSPQDKVITSKIIPLINKAEKYIYIPTFVITHKELTEALINAKNRGVNIKIIVDATSYGTRHSKNEELKIASIQVKGENLAGKLHTKSIIIDDKVVITGSMNFSNSGETKNDENSLIIEDEDIAKFYRKYFEYLWAKIPEKWIHSTIRAESKDSIGSCSDGLDNDYDGKTDSEDSACQ